MSAFKKHFADHPATVGQTYLEHFAFSASFSLRLLLASFTAIVHAIFPCFFEKNTSRSIEELSQRMQQRHGAK